ncbi:MAG TPA: tetratricopeptide repeat protein [Pseudochrobactrum sp.]|nr:tetratricopeptide repeat protein [Pseudochrobactrum sp. sp1633]HWD12397.1 tetratricopeptide repeat protein [Pseudochrobactrum sp.]
MLKKSVLLNSTCAFWLIVAAVAIHKPALAAEVTKPAPEKTAAETTKTETDKKAEPSGASMDVPAVSTGFTIPELAGAWSKNKNDKSDMLQQPATTDAMPAFNENRFGDKIADPAFGAFQRGLYLTAFNLGMERAKAGDAAAQTLVAEIYARGLGIKADQKQAAHWYGLAAEKNEHEAQFRYAAMLLQGIYVAKDAKKAEVLMQKAAEAGNAMAQFNYGQMLMMRNPGLKGLEEATPWFEKAADAGLADGEYAVSQILANGTSKIKRDDAKARDYLLRAARKNYDTAQLDLATWLVEGRGGERNFDAGFRWMLTAARGGNIAAMARVARLYRDGIGTDGNSVEAAAWYILARRSKLNAKDLDSFMDGLTDDEIQQAISRANNLR